MPFVSAHSQFAVFLPQIQWPSLLLNRISINCDKPPGKSIYIIRLSAVNFCKIFLVGQGYVRRICYNTCEIEKEKDDYCKDVVLRYGRKKYYQTGFDRKGLIVKKRIKQTFVEIME